MSNGDKAKGRQSIGRVDHVTFVYRTQERQEAARDEFSNLLGIDDWDEVISDEIGLRMLMSWGSGLELTCPTRPGSMVEDYLEKHGEGFFGLVVGVSDLDESLARFKKYGRDPIWSSSQVSDYVAERFDSFRSALMGEVGSVRTVLGEYKPKIAE